MDRMIKFDNLSNIRDLGGLIGADGRKIRPGKLYRGGNLYGASEADIRKLSEMLSLVVDFRTDSEIAEKQDPVIPGVENWHLPVLNSITEGVTREKSADADAFMRFAQDPEAAADYMKKTYEFMASSEFAISRQKKLLSRLLQGTEKGVLWHCTAGKDRTGGFALIMEEILGVSREDIIEDYLLTNAGNKETVDWLIRRFGENGQADPEKAVPALHAMFDAKEEYILAFYAEAERIYGSVEGFIREALGVSDEMKKEFRKLYLE